MAKEFWKYDNERTRTFIDDGESAVSSFCIRSAIPGNMVVPPDRTTLPYRSRRISRSHLKIELYVVSWIPAASRPRNAGWKSASGARKLRDRQSMALYTYLSDGECTARYRW